MSSSGRFPPIAPKSVGKIVEEGFYANTSSPNRSSLPRLSASQQGAYADGVVRNGKAVTRENSTVVNTSGGYVEESGLPEEWTQMRVNPPEHDDTHRTKLEWENQIAKHILSLFATSHATRNLNEGTALLDFVDVDKGVPAPHSAPAAQMTSDGINLLSTRPPHRPPTVPEDSDIEGGEGEKKKKKKRVKKVKKAAEATETEQTEPDPEKVKQHKERESQLSIAERVILRVHAEAEAAEIARGKTKAHQKDKHRITNTIKLKDGSEIVVRGTPRCFPIWFASTGDVYADWTVLPGGVKLQAHLNVLYEQRKYTDYLGIIETIIVDMWRKVRYGQENFTLGSFGHSASATGTPSASHTGQNSGNNTGNNTARSSRGRAHSSSTAGQRSRHNSHGGSAGLSGPAASSSYKNTSSKRGGGGGGQGQGNDDEFGDAVVWIETEDGLIPQKASAAREKGSPSRSPDAGRMQQSGAESRGGDGRGGEHRGGSPLRRTSSSSTLQLQLRGGTLIGEQQVPEQEPLLPESQLVVLWRQLILACIAMGILYLEKAAPDQAMILFKRAEEWAANDEYISSRSMRKELKAHVRDAISYYFFKRKKSIAALGYSEQAMALYEEVDNLDGIAVCLLHVAAVHSQIGDFKEAHKKLFQFLAMVESGRLATADATPKQLCLVAIGYHNLAVVQLKLAMPDLACKNSQNARKIARLCLSYSNRWIDTFQYTHEIAISDIKYELSTKKAKDLTPAQLALVIELSEALFDPYSDTQGASS